MYFVARQLEYKILNSVIRCYSFARKSHYEILRLRKNCTEKEIKEAFIKMSKEYHPDKNKDAAAQDKFVQIVEAYNVLSKAGSRAKYDSAQNSSDSTYVYRTYNPYNMRRNSNTQYSYQYQTHSQNSQNTSQSNSFYGVKGLKKVPNYVIILLCCSLAMVGCLLQMFVIREMYMIQRRQANEKSKYLAEELEKVRAAAKENANEVQTRLLLEKIVQAANPTVATASLGQALASEKK
ncbi:unnamed protein product [Diatraea saccharalis]|uniref:J domain-containing protein n=1 Tax=Diatraea saccharalis TaxID=40085 RepID=A0A9N9WF71_9NEOP|nr:unnamed protein product [Diatraea saccharalis]